MAPELMQALADASERDTAARYVQRREFVELVSDAIRRAEAMLRLETALRLQRR